jgi:nucleoside-specific outer membrane channel protein Tsx
VGVAAEPNGTQRNSPETMLDMRVEKSFGFENLGKLSLYLDIFNLGGSTDLSVTRNPNAYLYFYENPPRYTLDTNYGRINSVTGVRSIRLGVRWNY